MTGVDTESGIVLRTLLSAMVRVSQALHKGNAKLKSKLVAGFELDTVAGFHNWVSTHQ
jgi:hypothetical protein